jgi:neutral ceramidase
MKGHVLYNGEFYMEIPISYINLTDFIVEVPEDRMYRHFTCSRYSERKMGWIAALAVVAIVWSRSPMSPAADTETKQQDKQPAKVFRAGAYAVDITPLEFPVLVNGGVRERVANEVHDPLHARCLVLDDGTVQLAIVVVDSCLVPRSLADEAKALATKDTGIPTDRILISATHTHTAPSLCGCLGTDRDERYAKWLPGKIAEGIRAAHKNLQPARVGWAVGRDEKNVYCRRFLMKPDTALTNRYSDKRDDRAQMNPGYNNANAIRRTGPTDPAVTILSVQTRDGRPLALLGNYSTHYAGAPALSADYFAVFASEIGRLIGAKGDRPLFVGMMSNGTSGDANCSDFMRKERRNYDYLSVGREVAQAAFEAYKTIKYYDWVPLEMREQRLVLNVRMPTKEEVVKAREFMKTFSDRKPRNWEEVYARETVELAKMDPTRELKLQAIRIGDLGIAAIPCEVYGSTGLAIKAASPLQTTMNISLANGCEGYIAPPEQHKLGGYTAWRARTSCLEELAEPKIKATVVGLLVEAAMARRD